MRAGNQSNIQQITQILERFYRFDVEAFVKTLKITPASAPLIQAKLNKIKLQSSMALCPEQLIRILVEILSLKHDSKIQEILDNQGKIKFDEPFIALFISSISELLKPDEFVELQKPFLSLFEAHFASKNPNEKYLFGDLKTLCERNISCIDVDFVMNAAATAWRVRSTENKHAILVLGKTGSGKSFVINYIAAPEMFTRESMFKGGNIVIDTKKQPRFLKDIKIGLESVSETFQMSVVEVDNINSQGMEAFHKKGLVFGDTPGAQDNRKLGPELKLANALQTVVPAHRATSIRFLVLISANSLDARGEALRETIDFISRMFASAEAVRAAAPSMVLAISFDDGPKNFNNFVPTLFDFKKNAANLGLDDKSITLIDAFIAKFNIKDGVPFICPGKKPSASPISIMTRLVQCPPTLPSVLNPFAETEDIESKLETESYLITQSIDRILNSLGKGFDTILIKNQVQRLLIQFKNLSFLLTYYNINISNIIPYFSRLAEIMGGMKELIVNILCPENGAILHQSVINALNHLRLLDELDQMLRTLIQVSFSDSRDRVIDLIKAFNPKINIPENYKNMNSINWQKWVELTRPRAFVLEIENVLKQFRLSQVLKLEGLLQIMHQDLKYRQAQHLVELESFQQAKIEHAELVPLQLNSKAFANCIVDSLLAISQEMKPHFNLSEFCTKLKENVHQLLTSHVKGGLDFLSTLRGIVSNLHILNENFKDLFLANEPILALPPLESIQFIEEDDDPVDDFEIIPSSSHSNFVNKGASAPPLASLEIIEKNEDRNLVVLVKDPKPLVKENKDLYKLEVLKEEGNSILVLLQEYASKAIQSNNFALALHAFQQIQTLSELFSIDATNPFKKLQISFGDHLLRFISLNNKLLETVEAERLSKGDIQEILVNMLILQKLRSNKLLKPYLIGQAGFPSTIHLEMEKLSSTIVLKQSEIADIINTNCLENYFPAQFLNIEKPLSQLWSLLSLPHDRQKELIIKYPALVATLRKFCQHTAGVFTGQLKTDIVDCESTYKNLLQFMRQLADIRWIKILGLEALETDLKQALNERIVILLNQTDKVELTLGHENNLQKSAHLVVELGFLAQKAIGILEENTLSSVKSVLNNYQKRILITLKNISISANPRLEFLSQCERYLGSCMKIKFFPDQVREAGKNLGEFMSKHTKAQGALVVEEFQKLLPNSTVANFSGDRLAEQFHQYAELQKHIPALYKACGSPFEDWIKSLHNLISEYQIVLTSALQIATSGGVSQHEELVARVSSLQIFDPYIKGNKNEKSKPLTFKRLCKRFESAFHSEYFPKIKNVMNAVFMGDFAKAQFLVTEDKAFAPGTDIRFLLIEQIEIYMNSSVDSIARSIIQLGKDVSTNPVCMKELMNSSERVASAQVLVDAGLLTEALLSKRNELLIGVRSALDKWLSPVIENIQKDLARLNFKGAHQQFETLQKTLNDMPTKPSDLEIKWEALKNAFQEKINICMNQFKNPFLTWHKNLYSVAQVVAAFEAAKDISHENKSYSDYLKELCESLVSIIDHRCSEIVNGFSENTIGAKEAIEQLEYIQEIAENTPSDSILIVRIKTIFHNSVDKIQQNNLEQKKEEDRLKNIELMFASSGKFVRSLGELDLKNGIAYIQTTLKKMDHVIISAFSEGKLPEDSLIIFSDLFSKFRDKKPLQFIHQYCEKYVLKISEMVSTSIALLMEAKSRYGNGQDPAKALDDICAALKTLVQIQLLFKATKSRALLVDAKLPDTVVKPLLQFKDLLFANNDLCSAALKGRNADSIAAPLTMALGFQGVTMEIEHYINACDFQKLPNDFRDLKQLNNDYSYNGLRHKILLEIKEIKSQLQSLKPKALVGEGAEIRKGFYAQMKRDIEFIQNIAKLEKDFDSQILEMSVVSKDFGLQDCFLSISNFLAETFRLAYNQLLTVSSPSVTTNWVEFNRYYQELAIFVEQCGSSEYLGRLILKASSLIEGGQDKFVKSSVLANFLTDQFEQFLEKVVYHYKETYFVSPIPQNADEELVKLLAGFQKMAEDMPALKQYIKSCIKTFLSEIQAGRKSESYIIFLTEQLRKEETGFGARMVADQPIFAGMMVAERNRLTKNQNIDYVLQHLEIQDKNNGQIRAISIQEKEILLGQFDLFKQSYDGLIEEYISSQKDFAKFEKVHLEDLRKALLKEINQFKPEKDAKGRIIWNETIINQIPNLYAYLFTIWTLKMSPAFFDKANSTGNQDFLMRPLPGQIVAIFLMLGILDKSSGLQSNIDEVLTGEGKSVVLAATATLLALLGFAVDSGCYSEYLSGRDKKAFAWFFEFLGVNQFIQYGTFNGLSENELNGAGDLRNLMKNALFDAGLAIETKVPHHRETVAVVDEVDSLVTAFFGHLYQPYFLLQSLQIEKLLDAIWAKHQNGSLQFLSDLIQLPEYKACLEFYKDCKYLFHIAAREMFDDLNRYKPEQGHDFHVNSNGELYYKHFDGASTSKSIGYRTYWACRDIANNVSHDCKKQHQGIKVTCGIFSYADLMRDETHYRAMIGATGTYRVLTQVEKRVVAEVFGIRRAAFIPPMYGKSKFTFTPGTAVKVVADDEFNLLLRNDIAKARVGWNNGKPIRPVLVFFDSEAELNTFYHSEEFKEFKSDALRMTSETITNEAERDSLIDRATRSGQITLAVKDHGRGSDFKLMDDSLKANGGMAVLDAFIPETEADQRQHQGRMARQGQDGSFGMVIKMSELQKKFNMTEAEINKARDSGILYETIAEARNKKFSQAFQLLVDESKELLEKAHKPSMELLRVLRDPKSTREEVIVAHKKTLFGDKVRTETQTAKVLILFDSTGSMGDFIKALKETLEYVVINLGAVLDEYNCTFVLQIAHYEDYSSGPVQALRTTQEWSCDTEKLNIFIREVDDKSRSGGGNNSECVEVGLYFANELVNVGLQAVVLIGDEPPSTVNEMESLKKVYGKGSLNKDCAFFKAQHYQQETEKLKTAKVPVSTFFTRTQTFEELKDATGKYPTQEIFAEIARETGGDTGELDLSNSHTAANEVNKTIAKIVSKTIAGEDEAFADELLKKFETRTHQFSK